jgi:UDP:flavonoid glycosyltransferase YjiC (YdhE family)
MRVVLMTAGSRGDVAPYTGLCHALARAGHEVTLVTHERFAALAEEAGIGFHPLPVDPRAELESGAGQGLHRATTGAGKLARMIALARSVVAEIAEAMVAPAQQADVLLLSAVLAPLGHVLAEGLDLPSLGVYLQPLAPTAEFVAPVVGSRSLGRTGNRLSASAVNAALDAIFVEAARTMRRRLGLPPGGVRSTRHAREREQWPVMHGFSPLVVPRPRDWRAGLDICGYWWPYCSPTAQLPEPVRDFLLDGPPPVLVGLGSATVPDPARTSAALIASLRAAGLRGIVQRGWAGLYAEGDDMLAVDELPHALVLPHTAAVVHHGGAGTTAAALRAGVPSVPVPVQFDARFWAARLKSLGVSPGSVPLRTLNAQALTPLLTQAARCDPYRDRARRLGTLIRAEDGCGPVLSWLERLG